MNLNRLVVGLFPCVFGLLGLGSASLAQGRFPLDGGRLVLPGPVVFQPGSDRLDARAGPALGHMTAWLKAHPEYTLVRIEAHVAPKVAKKAKKTKRKPGKKGQERPPQVVADEVDPQVEALSRSRAVAVSRTLVARGIPCQRLMIVSFGARQPIESRGPAEPFAKSERIDLVAAAKNGATLRPGAVDGGGTVVADACQ